MLSILISAICLIAGISAAVLMLKSERKQLIFEEHDALKHASNSFITQFNRVIHNKSRADVPGWVLVVLMTTALVTGIWSIAAPKLTTILRNSLDAMGGIR